MKLTIKLVVVLTVLSKVTCVDHASINSIYTKAVKAYKDDNWSTCINYLDEVLHLYKLHRSVTNNCRHKCLSSADAVNVKEKIEDLKFFEIVFKRQNCFKHCLEKDFNAVKLLPEINQDIHFDLRSRLPYKYLHRCYYKIDDYPKAASAAYTYLVQNKHDADVDSLKFYMTKLSNPNDFIDFLSNDYIHLFNIGREAYAMGNWGETIAAMEEVLTDYFSAENNCRAECEEYPKYDWSPNFSVTLSNNIANLLQCYQNCQRVLQSHEFSSGVNFIAEVLNYLQICYFHSERYKEAAMAVESILLMHPNDEDQIENKKLYSQVSTDTFVDRPDIFFYYKRDSYEKYLLSLISKSDDDHNIYM